MTFRRKITIEIEATSREALAFACQVAAETLKPEVDTLAGEHTGTGHRRNEKYFYRIEWKTREKAKP